ncbi:hypothetical protein [Microcystis phage Mae-JY24]
MLNTQINFATATRDSITDLGVTALDFLALRGSNVIATCVGYVDNYGPAVQDGTIWKLDGDDAMWDYVVLTNGESEWMEESEIKTLQGATWA